MSECALVLPLVSAPFSPSTCVNDSHLVCLSNQAHLLVISSAPAHHHTVFHSFPEILSEVLTKGVFFFFLFFN